VLVLSALKTGAILLPAIAIVALLVLGGDAAIGVIIGGVLSLGDGLAIVWLAGELLDPSRKTNKAALLIVLLLKLAVVGALLWASLAVWGISGLGVIIGLAAGLGALVFGVNRGSSSAAGRRAMEEAEARIREELGDNEADSS
jgi:hypothetical protein